MKKSAEEILREYITFNDVNQSETVEILPLTIVDAMEEYESQDKTDKTYTEKELVRLLQDCAIYFGVLTQFKDDGKTLDRINNWINDKLDL